MVNDFEINGKTWSRQDMVEDKNFGKQVVATGKWYWFGCHSDLYNAVASSL
jgi:hypothetical protein